MQVLAVMLCALTILFWAPDTSAHASLISSVPPAGAVLPSAPAQARLVFNEPVSPLVLKIIQPDGSALDLRQVQTLTAGLQLSLPALSQQGAYALSWRVVSTDGHPVGGTLIFSVGVKGAIPAQAVSAHQGRAFLIWLSRLIWYAGLFFGIGLAVWHSLGNGRRDTPRLALWTLALAAGATLLNVGLLGVDALDLPLSGLLDLGAWSASGSTSFGLSASLAVVALGCAALVWRMTSVHSKRLLAALAVAFAGTALAASGHASAAPPAWLARPAVWLHAVAIILWIGSLWPLARTLSDAPDLTSLQRFSRLIPAVLLLLYASGSVLIFLQFDTLSSLWLTSYGQVLLIKLILLATLLGLGAYNRYRLTSAVLHADVEAQRAMRRVIYLECVLAFAILAVVALWRFTPPPRALNAAPAMTHVVSADIQARSAIASLAFTTASSARSATLTLHLSNPDSTPLAAKEVDVAFSNAAAGIEPVSFSAIQTINGAWQIESIELPHQDSWHIRIDALITDFDRINLETTLNLSE